MGWYQRADAPFFWTSLSSMSRELTRRVVGRQWQNRPPTLSSSTAKRSTLEVHGHLPLLVCRAQNPLTVLQCPGRQPSRHRSPSPPFPRRKTLSNFLRSGSADCREGDTGAEFPHFSGSLVLYAQTNFPESGETQFFTPPLSATFAADSILLCVAQERTNSSVVALVSCQEVPAGVRTRMLCLNLSLDVVREVRPAACNDEVMHRL